MKNIFMENQKEITFEEYMAYKKDGRENLGDNLPVAVYRMLEYSLRNTLIEEYGKETQIKIFRKAGYQAGTFFAKNYLNCDLPLERFLGDLQTQMETMKIGVLRVEGVNSDDGTIMLTVSEDANMNHLTCQAKQVAAGDYSQHASYLGEFSEAFNTMIEQLRERENLLMKKAEMAENYNRLLIELTHSHQECIMVVDAHSGEIVYCNKSKNGDGEFAEGKCSTCCGCEQRLTIHDEILKWKDTEKKISRNDSDKYTVWEKEDSEGRIYQITTYAIEWKEKEVYVHIITDITESRRKGMILEDKAYRDPGTGLYNRRYFEEYMERALLKREQLTLCYIDIDGLKYVNDKYGYLEGDNYIAMIVAAIKNKAKYIRV